MDYLQREAERWAEIRAEWLQTHPVLTAAAAAKRAGCDTGGAATLLANWEARRRVFGLAVEGQRLYPAFLFDLHGEPVPHFHSLLVALDRKLDDWPLAIWLTSPNAEFEGWATPLDVISRDPDAVAAAGRIEVQASSY